MTTFALDIFEHRIELIRDRVRGVAHGYHTAFYLVGRSGTSKTFTVLEELERLEETGTLHVYRNAQMTPMGLFELLVDNPEHVIVLDDINTLFSKNLSMQILMAATGGEPNEPRLVSYKSKNEDHQTNFSGGIIAISNVPLRHDPLAHAFASRAVIVNHEPTDADMCAFIFDLAEKGTDDHSPEECQEVAEFLIAETRDRNRQLDVRQYTKALQDFRQDRDGFTGCSWKELVRTSLCKSLMVEVKTPPKTHRMERDREKVREAMSLYPGDTRKQIEFSGLGKSTFYARRAELKRQLQIA